MVRVAIQASQVFYAEIQCHNHWFSDESKRTNRIQRNKALPNDFAARAGPEDQRKQQPQQVKVCTSRRESRVESVPRSTGKGTDKSEPQNFEQGMSNVEVEEPRPADRTVIIDHAKTVRVNKKRTGRSLPKTPHRQTVG
jgi:hypothetical protein